MRFSASGHRRRPAPFHVSVFVEIQTIFDLFGVSTAMANTPSNGIANGLPPLFRAGGLRSLQLSLRFNF